MKLHNWAIVSLNLDPYMAPECQPKGLHGEVHGSTFFEDGTSITTSRLVKVEIDGPLTFIHTVSGSLYELGEVNPNYEAAYPGALERLRKAVPA